MTHTCNHTHIRKTGPTHDKFLKVYRKQVIPMHRAVLSWLRLIDRAVLYGLDQQLIRGNEADTSAATKYEAYNPSPIEKRFIELRAQQLADSFNVQKAKPPFTNVVNKIADWNCIRVEGDNKIGPHHIRTYGKAGQVAGQLADISTPWNVVNKKAVKWAIKNTNELVTLITDQTKEALRVIIASGINRGRSMATVTRSIRRTGSVGLNVPQAKAIVNFENNLLAREAIIKEALQASNNSLTGAQDWLTRKHWKIPNAWVKQVRDGDFDIPKRLNKKTKTMLRYRSEMIARTETARAVSEGSLEIYGEAKLEYVIFDASADACIVCDFLDGNKYTVGEAGGIIPQHPNCRCSWRPPFASELK